MIETYLKLKTECKESPNIYMCLDLENTQIMLVVENNDEESTVWLTSENALRLQHELAYLIDNLKEDV